MFLYRSENYYSLTYKSFAKGCRFIHIRWLSLIMRCWPTKILRFARRPIYSWLASSTGIRYGSSPEYIHTYLATYHAEFIAQLSGLGLTDIVSEDLEGCRRVKIYLNAIIKIVFLSTTIPDAFQCSNHQEISSFFGFSRYLQLPRFMAKSSQRYSQIYGGQPFLPAKWDHPSYQHFLGTKKE